ncbi:MAG TPA: glutathione S-transferase family protein, partial [Alphaproteobacteria bacterium]|nr:glutathione S-transferase family protein [Alphaproteobacteria bacterium]
DPADRTAFKALWPVGKFPLLRDDARDRTVPESTVIIEYLDAHYPGRTKLIPADPGRARQVRLVDRFIDLHIHLQMQKVMGDRLRPADKKDPYGVDEARAQIATALGVLDRDMAGKTWAMGDEFTLADCAAAPALFYANMVQPFGDSHENVAAYLQRLMKRPSYARALKEAEPYFKMVPQER